MGIIEIRDCLTHFKKLGAEAITITGGGEPTMHKDFDRILITAEHRGYKIGMVTNGIEISKGHIDFDLLNQTLTWLRISVFNTQGYYDAEIIAKISEYLTCDIGVSFTITPDVNMTTVIAIDKLAKLTPNITHIRFVTDILTANNVDTMQAMDEVKRVCTSNKGIFQYRNIFTQGSERCLIGQVKPVINVDGYVYPCCGVQYATEEQRTMPERFRMMKWKDYAPGIVFDGSICSKCYYNDYNICLQHMTEELQHKEFI